jgi:exopolysaccharide biosynthesis polyprenyl glycosylphosphotransferase
LYLSKRGGELIMERLQINEQEIIEIERKKSGLYSIVKRILDIMASVLGLIILSPILLVVTILIKLESRGPAIFSQKRIGLNGKEFKMYKFRSMAQNADEILKELLKDEEYKKEWDLNQKFNKDPRITKIGNFLRKTSLDEIPQFINVLKGDMSLIGPRPLVSGELDAHNGNHELYESVRPGISGWWGVNGRSETTYQERLLLEYYYIENYSFMLDIKCIFKTIKVVLFKKGAK